MTCLLVRSTGSTTEEPTPVSGAAVTWKLLEIPGQVSFASSSTTTAASGLTTNTINIGSAVTGEITAQADSPGATSTCVLAIEVNPLLYTIRILGGNLVTVTNAPTASVAEVEGAVGTTATLTVQVDVVGNTPTPVPNQLVTYQFVTAIQGAEFPLNAGGTVSTNASGVAAIQLFLGATVGAYEVVAGIPGDVRATFDVEVLPQPLSCQISSDCGTGYLCIGSQCQSGTTCSGFGDQDARSATRAVRMRAPVFRSSRSDVMPASARMASSASTPSARRRIPSAGSTVASALTG